MVLGRGLKSVTPTSFNIRYCWVCGKEVQGILKDKKGYVCLKCDLLPFENKLEKHKRSLRK